MLKKCALLSVSLLLSLSACSRPAPLMPQRSPFIQNHLRTPFQSFARKRAGLNMGFFYAMDDYNGDTLKGAKYLHSQLAMVGSNETNRIFLSADSDVQNDGIWAEVSKGQSWMGEGFQPRGELDTGRTPALRDFLSWMSREHASTQNMVTLSSHGGGYRGILYDYDGNVHGPSESLSLKQTFKALGKGFQGSRLDNLHFAACMMATIEVGDALKAVTASFSGSEDFSFGGSTPWERILMRHQQHQSFPKLVQDTVESPFVDGAFAKHDLSQTWSAISLNQDFVLLVKSVDRLAKALLKAMPSHGPQIQKAVRSTRMFASMKKWSGQFGDFYQRDIVDFCEQLLAQVNDPHIQEDARDVIARVQRVVLAEAHSPDQTMAHGLAIYLPFGGKFNAKYRDSVFARNTRWDEFLIALNS